MPVDLLLDLELDLCYITWQMLKGPWSWWEMVGGRKGGREKERGRDKRMKKEREGGRGGREEEKGGRERRKRRREGKQSVDS